MTIWKGKFLSKRGWVNRHLRLFSTAKWHETFVNCRNKTQHSRCEAFHHPLFHLLKAVLVANPEAEQVAPPHPGACLVHRRWLEMLVLLTAFLRGKVCWKCFSIGRNKMKKFHSIYFSVFWAFSSHHITIVFKDLEYFFLCNVVINSSEISF